MSRVCVSSARGGILLRWPMASVSAVFAIVLFRIYVSISFVAKQLARSIEPRRNSGSTTKTHDITQPSVLTLHKRSHHNKHVLYHDSQGNQIHQKNYTTRPVYTRWPLITSPMTLECTLPSKAPVTPVTPVYAAARALSSEEPNHG